MRIIKFKYRLLDKNELFKRYLKVIKCSTGYDSLSKLKRSASMTVENKQDIDFNNDRVQIVCNLDNEETILATLIISGAKKNYSNFSRDIECFDKLLILEEDKLEERLTIKAGTNIIGAIIAQLQGNKHKFEPLSYMTKVDIDFEIGTPRLDIINYLLKVMNYESLITDNEGYFTANPYILPQKREIQIEYNDIHMDKNCIVLPQVEEEIDLFNIPNVFVRATNNSQIAPLRVVYTNSNPESPSSTVNRGRKIVDFKTVDDVLDYQTLYNIAQRDAISASNVYKHISLPTGINPKHGYLNCVRLNIKDYGIDEKFIETSWRIEDCNPGGKMTHMLRRLVNV